MKQTHQYDLVAPVLPAAQLKVPGHVAHKAKLLLEVVLAHGTAEDSEYQSFCQSVIL